MSFQSLLVRVSGSDPVGFRGTVNCRVDRGVNCRARRVISDHDLTEHCVDGLGYAVQHHSTDMAAGTHVQSGRTGAWLSAQLHPQEAVIISVSPSVSDPEIVRPVTATVTHFSSPRIADGESVLDQIRVDIEWE